MPKCKDCAHLQCVWVGAETRVGLCDIFVKRPEATAPQPVSPSKSSDGLNVALREIEIHNSVTMTIVVGLLLDNADIPLTAVATKIMELFKRRGYEPQILACNRLLDGTNV